MQSEVAELLLTFTKNIIYNSDHTNGHCICTVLDTGAAPHLLTDMSRVRNIVKFYAHIRTFTLTISNIMLETYQCINY